MTRFLLSLFLFAGLGFSGLANAGNATHCIDVGYGKEYKWDKKNKRYLINKCSRKVEVFWCHNNSARKHQGSVCGGKKFYRKHTVLEPGAKKFNMYNLPENGTIRYGACYGGYYSASGFTPNGRFRCKNR